MGTHHGGWGAQHVEAYLDEIFRQPAPVERAWAAPLLPNAVVVKKLACETLVWSRRGKAGKARGAKRKRRAVRQECDGAARLEAVVGDCGLSRRRKRRCLPAQVPLSLRLTARARLWRATRRGPARSTYGDDVMAESEHTFTVAAVGPAFGYVPPPRHTSCPIVGRVLPRWRPRTSYPPIFGGPTFADQGPELPYGQRRKAVVRASGGATLGEIIDRAAAHFGTTFDAGPISENITGIVFYEPEDEGGLKPRPEPWPATIRVVRHDGRPSWAIRWAAVTVDELLDAHSAGLVAGDPYRPYFWPVFPQGDLPFQEFVDALWRLWAIWDEVLTAYGTWEVARRIVRRVRRGRKVIAANHTAWEHRLVRPHVLFAYLTATPRRTDEIAARIGCTLDETEGVMLGVGFALGEDGRWRRAGDDPARILHSTVEMIERRGAAPGRADVQAVIRTETSSEEPTSETDGDGTSVRPGGSS